MAGLIEREFLEQGSGNRGGNRGANAALYRVAIVRMRRHPPTRAYVERRTAEGKAPREIRRCLKRSATTVKAS